MNVNNQNNGFAVKDHNQQSTLGYPGWWQPDACARLSAAGATGRDKQPGTVRCAILKLGYCMRVDPKRAK